MNWLIVHLASGQAFFSGILLIGVAVGLGLREGRKGHTAAALLAFLGGLFVFLSTTPLPLWFYVPACIVMLVWLALFRNRSLPRNRQRQLALAVGGIGLTGLILEAPFHLTPTIPSVPESRELTILGDSVTAGVRDGETTWPMVLEASSDWTIHDLSFAGATTGTALKSLRDVDIAPGIVLIELGGNDILGAGDLAAYERNLDELLKLTATPGRIVVMLELPLPPLHHRYGQIQRTLADRYGVHLIPKRVLISVLLSKETTLDSIHLSPEGHERMAELIREILP